MQCCASCGKSRDLRLYEVHGDPIERRWWCLECMFSARRRGLSVESVPVWIERAALHQLPMKSFAFAQAGADLTGPNATNSTLVRLRQHLMVLDGDPDRFDAEDLDDSVVEPMRSRPASAAG
jgi:hypothetical protein